MSLVGERKIAIVDVDLLERLRFRREKKTPSVFSFPKVSRPRIFFTPIPHHPRLSAPMTYSRSVVVKVSYRGFSPARLSSYSKTKVSENTRDAIDYIMRMDDVTAFDNRDDEISKEAVDSLFSDDAVFKIMISPEDGEVLTREYVREIVHSLDAGSGHKLKWIAVFHNDEHPHAHIMISRTQGSGLSWEKPLAFDKATIKNGIRKTACDLSTRSLGRKSRSEYKRPFYESIHSDGLARIDHVIGGNERKGTNLFIPEDGRGYASLSLYRLSKLPEWQQALVKERLSYLSTIQSSLVSNIDGEWRIYNYEGWKDRLMINQKLKPFASIANGRTIKPIIWASDLEQPFSGTVIAHEIVDEVAGKVGILIEDDSGRLSYVESEMLFKSLATLDGSRCTVSPKEQAKGKYRLPEVKVMKR